MIIGQKIQTVLGIVDAAEIGRMLPHEHLLVAFIEEGNFSAADYDQSEVVEMMLPLLMKLKDEGCGGFVDCSPIYLGRDPYLLRELSEKSGIHIMTNTGFYKTPYLAPEVHVMSSKEMAELWISEAKDGIGKSGVRPGFIKIAVNEGRVNPLQEKILYAAVQASLETGLPIQCHTVGAEAAAHVGELLETCSFDCEKWIWVHAQTAFIQEIQQLSAQKCEITEGGSHADLELFQRLGDRGMWISIDHLHPPAYEQGFALLQGLVDCGLTDRLLLSQDSGWYNVGQERGGLINPFHLLFQEFLPYAQARGWSKEMLERLIVFNPAMAMRLRTE